jgi:hypothetical protein
MCRRYIAKSAAPKIYKILRLYIFNIQSWKAGA